MERQREKVMALASDRLRVSHQTVGRKEEINLIRCYREAEVGRTTWAEKSNRGKINEKDIKRCGEGAGPRKNGSRRKVTRGIYSIE